ILEGLKSHSGRLVIFGVDMGNVGDVEESLDLQDATGGSLGLALVLLDDIHTTDLDAILLGENLNHFTGLALVLAGDNDDLVVLLDLSGGHYNTSGASEMIFMNFLPRSSR